jgi:choloylglycine hydrolase
MDRCLLTAVVACGIVVGACTPAEIERNPESSLPIRTGSGCSAISLAAGGSQLFGANLDYDHHTRGQLFINKRGVHKTGMYAGTTGVYAAWVSAYASVTFNFVGYHYPWSGMNEEGLVMSTMALPQTVYPPPDSRPVADSGFWIQYLLDTCATVDEVIAADELVRNITVDHYLVADRYGASAVIEYINGEFVVYTGDDLPVSVLTNWFYDDSLQLWRSVRGNGNYSRLDSSLQRFCIAADRVSSFERSTVDEDIDFAFDTLDAIAAQRVSESASQWSMVFDTGASRVYFKTFANPDLRYVDLNAFSPRCGRTVQMLDIDEPLAGDVSTRFRDYSHSEALDHLLWFIGFWETDATPAWARQVLYHVEGYPCPDQLGQRRGRGRVRPRAEQR